MPGLGDLVGGLSDDHYGTCSLDGDNAHRAADELRPDHPREPGRHIGLDAGPLPVRRPRRHEGELTDLVHQHDAHMAQMLELKRQLLIELVSLALGFQVPHGCFDEALSNLQSGLDLDPRRGARVQDRDAAGDERGKKIDRSNGEEKLGSDRPVIPKFLQHGSQVSRALTPCMRARGLRAATGKMSSLFP